VVKERVMSSSLMWKPVKQASGSLPKDLKYPISRRLWGTDGSMGYGSAIVDSSFIGYLEGLQDAGVKGAEELIGLINEHGEVELWHEH
jgi:hypothetical protein